MVPVLSAKGTAAATVNFTTYRVTPIHYPGLANMDSGDAAVSMTAHTTQ
jgi:hypothetical protein